MKTVVLTALRKTFWVYHFADLVMGLVNGVTMVGMGRNVMNHAVLIALKTVTKYRANVITAKTDFTERCVRNDVRAVVQTNLIVAGM